MRAVLLKLSTNYPLDSNLQFELQALNQNLRAPVPHSRMDQFARTFASMASANVKTYGPATFASD